MQYERAGPGQAGASSAVTGVWRGLSGGGRDGLYRDGGSSMSRLMASAMAR
jgi:hypothetical protein